MKPFYIAGKATIAEQAIEVINPFSQEVIDRVCLASEDQVDQAVQLAVEGCVAMKKLSSHQRYVALKQIAEGLRQREAEFAQLIVQEAGKPIRFARGEVQRAIQTFTVAAEECKRLPGEVLDLDWTEAGRGKQGMVKHVPRGVVAGIAPFNFPLNLVAHKVAPAIATGCPIVLKPASSTPLSSLALAELIYETDLPKACLSVVPCNRETGSILVEHEDVAVLSFTGSDQVGWNMKSRAGKKKVVLELGGNAALICSESAALDKAIEKSVVGAFAYAGQVCIHTQRIYVHNSMWDQFRSSFVDQVKQLTFGDPNVEAHLLSSMIDEGNANRVEAWVEEAVEAGAEVLHRAPRQGNLVGPIVLTNCPADCKVVQEEVFGPVVVLEKYDAFEAVLEQVNATRYGLQTGLFTDSHREIQLAFDRLEVGGLVVNDIPTFRVDHMPYGGVKDSGFGREGIKYAMMDYLEPKLLVYDSAH